MDQPEEILEKLERFNGQKNPEIPRELDEYVSFVARKGKNQIITFLKLRLTHLFFLQVILSLHGR